MRVAAAMSGGVDSSVAAALLLEAGHEVIGVTLKVWDESRCCSLKDADDARSVARKLSIPHYVLDAREAFEEMIISPFVASFTSGLVPNPCVLCNRRLKFDWLVERAALLGCEMLATGHYARIGEISPGRRALLRGVDHAKDQSYFVVPENSSQLDRLLFPLGGFSKAEIRARATALNLPVADKPDSQDLCFLPPEGLGRFMETRLGPARTGEIVDLTGKILGRHSGALNYTIGQRRGLGVAWAAPLYVVAKEMDQNRVVVGPRRALDARFLTLVGCGWLAGEPPPDAPLSVRTRSTGQITPCRVEISDSKARVEFRKPQFAVTPGQLAVFYNGETVVGSGWIESWEPWTGEAAI